ncbi:hypothetical protein [Paenibacillus sp. BK720]|uniref:hypothetical protein n=1 Tax=Paenibacillus sp. BK720 TaxID=2587092 RepID=UPI001ABBD5B6|nr:hypothetical protein [Paenibacillus sp. BK720]
MTAKGSQQRPPAHFAGWISEKWGVAWVVSAERQDKRVGVLSVSKPKESEKPETAYILQYTHRDDLDGRETERLHGIAAGNHKDAIKKALAFMEEIALRRDHRQEAKLFFQEREVTIWTEPCENAASAK